MRYGISVAVEILIVTPRQHARLQAENKTTTMAPVSQPWRFSILLLLFFCMFFINTVSGVKSSDFKTCSQVFTPLDLA